MIKKIDISFYNPIGMVTNDETAEILKYGGWRMERTAQHYWQGSNLARALPGAKTLPKVLHASLIAHHNIPGQLFQAWLSHIQSRQSDSRGMAAFSFADFSHENALVMALNARMSAFPQESYRIGKFCELLQQQCVDVLKVRGMDSIKSTSAAAKQHIAQLIYLTDQDLPAAAAMADSDDVQGSLTKIKEAFDTYVQKNLRQITDLVIHHDQVPIQNSTLAAVRKKALVIADMLLTSSGHVNLGLIDLIQGKFFNQKVVLLPHERQLLQTLEILARSSPMQAQFHAIVKPFSPYLLSNDIIRASLKLPPKYPIEDRHAKLAVLAAFLSDIRQGEVGCCFSTCASFKAIDALKERVLSDLISLISQGKVSREGRKDQKDFMPILHTGDGVFQSKMILESTGKLVYGSGYVWEAPGMVAACRQLEIADEAARDVVEKAIKQIYEERNLHANDLMEVSPKALFKKIINNLTAPCKDRRRKWDLKSRAFLAFNSEISCPLLSAWEGCLMSIAETKSNKMLKRKISHCIESVIAPQWPKPFLPFINNDNEQVQRLFKTVLNNNMRLCYDSQAAVFGAFVLHELKQGTCSLVAEPIKTPGQFKKFALKQVERTKEIVAKANNKNLQKHLEALDAIHTFISKPDSVPLSFIKEAIKHYDAENRRISDPLAAWTQLDHLPFKDTANKDAVPAYAKTVGINPGHAYSGRPKNAEDLLKAFIAWSKTHLQTDHSVGEDNPFQRYTKKTTQHVFALHPHCPPSLDADSVVEDWLQKHVREPGKQISQLPLTVLLKEKFLQAICTKILSPELVQEFTDAVGKIPSNYATLALYGNELLKLLQIMHPHSDTFTAEFLRCQLTDLLLEDVLPIEKTHRLVDSAVRLADTQWKDKGTQSLSFACFYNPLSERVELALLDEASKRLSAVHQEEWIAYIPWEMYGIQLPRSA